MSEVIRIEPDDCEVTLKSAQRLSEALGYEWGTDCVGSKELFFVDQDGKRTVKPRHDALGYHNFPAGKADEWVREMAETSFRRLMALPIAMLSTCSKRFGFYIAGLIRENWDLRQILSEQSDPRKPLLDLLEDREREIEILQRDHAFAQEQIGVRDAQLREKDDRIAQLTSERDFERSRRVVADSAIEAVA